MTARILPWRRLGAAVALALVLADASHAAAYDPLEPVNRKIFAFNEFLDEWVVRPVAETYRDWMPKPIRTGAANVFSNVGDVFSFVNNVLQAKPEAAVDDFYRVVLNTTIGLGGVFDLASDAGFEKRGEDFGQTLGVWGVGPGPYLVLPFFGPSSLRDATGTAVQGYFDPVFQIDNIPLRNTAFGWQLVDLRTSLLGADTLLTEAAFDKYTFVRDFYLQRRRTQIYDGEPPVEPDADGDAEATAPVSGAVSAVPATE